MEQQHYFDLAMCQIKHVGPKTIRQLISYCGSSEAVFKASSKQLNKIPGIGPDLISKLKSKEVFSKTDQACKQIKRSNSQFYFYTHEDYPTRLKNFPDAPAGFYYKGKARLKAERTLAVVGTRTPTEHGKKACRDFIAELQKFKPCIISGLAIGIDTQAHKAALDNQLNTIAILGQGFPDIYPNENRKLALEIIEQGGLITEFGFNIKADPRHFPQRNRIIAMLSDAVLVVESKSSGGSIITAEFANEYYKDVFAIPGRIRDQKSKGCLQLIKSNKAALVECADDIAQFMNWDNEIKSLTKQRNLFVELNEEEQKIFKILNDLEEVELNKLHYLSEVKLADLSTLLLHLEFKGLVKSLPGKKYTIT